MSEPQPPANDGNSSQDDPVTEPVPQTSEQHSSEEDSSMESPHQESHKSAGRGLGLVALLVALCALGLAAWQWSQEADDSPGGDTRQTIDDLASRLSELEQSFSSQGEVLQQVGDQVSDARLDEYFDDRIERRIERRIDSRIETRIESHVDPVEEQIGALNTRLDQISETVNDTQASLGNLQDSLRSVEQQQQGMVRRIEQAAGEQREVDQELALRLMLLEASALLRFGQSQAELADDYVSAAAAYRRAQSLLQSSADPRLGQARQQLASELDGLTSVDGPDWAGAQARLARLSNQVESWPLTAVGTEPSTPDVPTDSDDGWWAGMKTSLGQLVEVERRDPLELDDDQVSALHDQLRLRLTAAELAIERRDLDSMRSHLERVDQWIERHFEPSDPDVADARATLDRVRSLRPAEPPAALGRSLASLAQVLEAL